ncbi:MAG: hypothetical protein KJ871_16810 [Alphaproteobacteria bacterium]|nr:hypothetical protein [Alphaproteobacteria bacterium]MBU2082695.1 hypothetical protein [Alphaproteobacteria bacterium]MBU2142208.1 hypothetical protein [Alphaproteobacteria bacterium]MBU2196749.1 hypothetical protein [Alphaproteobacteria bacterium]
MRRLIIALAVASSAALIAVAQEEDQAEPNAPTTYFLVDASGSMQDKLNAANGEVAARLSEMLKTAPSTQVSLTYFRADLELDEHACQKPISVSAKQPASEVQLSTPDFRKDSTPLGAALEAALLDAQEGPAEIFILSDEDQTSNCGTDICEIANTYLPQEDVTVTLVPFGAAASNQDRLGCIEAAQGRQYQRSALAGGAAEDDLSQGDDEGPGFWREVTDFFAKWFWFIGFIFISLSAVLFGVKDVGLSIKLENKTRELQALRNSILVQSNAEAEQKLKVLIDSQEEADKAERDRTWSSKMWEKAKSYRNAIFAATIGIPMLVLVTFFPGISGEGGFLRLANTLAWQVLNTEFSTAFAVIWIATLFFAGVQYQRRVESWHNFSIATDDARRARAAQTTRAKKLAYDKYTDALQNLSQVEFREPWSNQTRSRAIVTTDSDRANLKLVIEKAIQFAIGEKLEIEDADDTKFLREAQRLSAITPRSVWFGSKPDLAAFIRDLEMKNVFPKEHSIDWLNLSKALSNSDNRSIKLALKGLVEKL